MSNITFRTQLVGSVTEFCQESGLELLRDPFNLVELIVLLARYSEEGVSLSPKVYITDNITLLLSMLPYSEKLKIGISSLDTQGIKQVLKKCAPLAEGGWLVYIQTNTNEIEYGLFKGTGNPISVLVDDVLLVDNDSCKIVKTFQVADDCVEIRSNVNSLHYIFLNHRKENSPAPLHFFDELINAITNKVDEDNRDSTKSFLSRLLFDGLRQSHGCIIAVTSSKNIPKFLSNDGIILDNPINFSGLVDELRKEEIDAHKLESKGHLLHGMLNSDGIILFDDKGQLLGYNCFVKVSGTDGIIGGARKRAFAGVCMKIGRGVSAVFMQSQDGWTDFKG